MRSRIRCSQLYGERDIGGWWGRARLALGPGFEVPRLPGCVECGRRDLPRGAGPLVTQAVNLGARPVASLPVVPLGGSAAVGAGGCLAFGGAVRPALWHLRDPRRSA